MSALRSLVWVLAGILLAFGPVCAAPGPGRRQTSCTSPKKRYAWHMLSDADKKTYINAELCLMSKGATLGLRGAKTMFDEFQSLHVLQAEIRHFTGSFLPWHRLMMWAHEQALEKHCGYKGGQPYWQQQRDAGKFLTSDVLNPATGFGGNGVAPTYCIRDGPFANYTNSMGPGYQITQHCIQRQVNELFSRAAAQTEVDRCLRATTFIQAWNCIEGSPHSAGHGGVGAQMLNGESSPGDPTFYLHHTWIDKIWWDWQALGLPARLTEIGGRNKWAAGGAGGGFAPPGGGFGSPFGGAGAVPAGFSVRPTDVPAPKVLGDPGTDVTLTHVLEMLGIVPNMAVADVMDIKSALCYEYVNPTT